MFFKKKSTTKNKIERRRPRSSGSSGRTTVFSYHANRSSGPSGGTRPAASRKLWQADADASPAPKKPKFAQRLRRLPALVLGIAAIVLVVNGLILSSEPEVVAFADAQSRQVFLRDEATYQQAAHEILASSIANTNKVTIDTAGIETKLRERFPELEHVSVTLPLFGYKPAIYIQPSRPTLLLKAADGLYVLDAAGHALMNASGSSVLEKLQLPVVEDQSGLPVTLGKVALPSDNVAFITEVVGQLKAKNIETINLVVPLGTSELLVGIKDAPYQVKFNLRGDARAEAGSYLAVRKHLEREQKTPSMYIDVRVDNRAYYR